MKYGLSVPNFGSYADVRALADLARDAEAAGWDGFFIWDHIQNGGEPGAPMCDPWIALAAIALATGRIRLGTMVTPLARRRPWVVARQTTTLDNLSGGRVTLGIGLGFPPEEFSSFGEDPDARTRARKLDEALDVLTGLWSGKPFSYTGAHFRIAETSFAPTPLQSPRIPIWVAGMWPNQPPFRRAARYDGVVPLHADISPLTPDEVREIVALIRSHRPAHAKTRFDVVLSGEHGGSGPFAWKEPLSAYEAAGASWWLESLTDWRGSIEQMRAYVRNGPAYN